jgi:hypothetical protein
MLESILKLWADKINLFYCITFKQFEIKLKTERITEDFPDQIALYPRSFNGVFEVTQKEFHLIKFSLLKSMLSKSGYEWISYSSFVEEGLTKYFTENIDYIPDPDSKWDSEEGTYIVEDSEEEYNETYPDVKWNRELPYYSTFIYSDKVVEKFLNDYLESVLIVS